MGDYQKRSLEWNCAALDRLVTRGLPGSAQRVRGRHLNRIPLSAASLLEIVQLAYYAIFNDFAVSC